MGKRVILTGGTGFVGANLARRLLGEGHQVHLLVRPQHDPWRIASVLSELRLHEVDLTDRERLARRVAAIRPEWIFHLAAYGAYSSQNDVHRMVETNAVGTVNLVEACLASGFDAFIHTGSSSEYGFKDHAPAETESPDPNSLYAVTKASATLYCRYVARAHDVHLCTLRLYSVFGPYEEPSRLIPTLILRGREGKLPPLVNPEIARDFVYIDDVVEAFGLAARRPGGERGAVYNVGTGIQTNLRQVVETVRRVMKVGEEPLWGTMPDRSWDTQVWVADRRKISDRLGWKPEYGFEAGFRRFLEWFDEEPDHWNLYRRPR